MQEILKFVQAAAPDDGDRAPRKIAFKDLGFVSCSRTVAIKHVPFYDPCLILVLSGRKLLYEGRRAVVCEAGSAVTVPAPTSVNLRNEPDPSTKKYLALIVPLKVELFDRLSRSHGLLYEVKREPVGILKFDADETLCASLTHYLKTVGNAKLLAHRLMEILLILVTRHPSLWSYALYRENWSQRVRAVLSADLAKPWDIAAVCQRLATTESTLRRYLKREQTSFRELLYELRLSAALIQLLQTSLPIYRIAYDCGYRSVSRFTSNFHQRFGVPPKQFRESEQRRTSTRRSRAAPRG